VTGFRPKRGPFKLDFAGTEFEGLEVTVRPVPMSVMLDISATIASGDLTAFRHVAATFAYSLESWNVEDDDGHPASADMDGLASQDSRFATALLKAWTEAMHGATPRGAAQ
jgi:hypothetical protein